MDNFAGRDGSPPDIALAIGISPTSSAWPALAGASIAYGLTEGGVNANATVDERDSDMGGGAVYHDNRVEVTAA